MCGLIATFPKKNYRVCTSTLRSYLDTINHRGPDGEGIVSKNWYTLGHKRLAIIDPKHSQQPFQSRNERYAISYNGEIYNYIEIRTELKNSGYIFETSGDTEVIIHAFDKWGVDCFNIFEGMFAFALIDNYKKIGYLVRDQLGIKPLFYLETSKGIIFSSEIKVFLNEQSLSLNESRIYEQIMYRYISGKETIYNEIQRVNAGSYIEIDSNFEYNEIEYFSLEDSLINSNNNVDYHQIENEINKSILRHTRSDVGYNIQLSGGLDSSYITSVLAKTNSQIRTYSVTLNSEDDEKRYQEYISKKYNTNHHELELNDNNFIDAFEKATWHMDMPIIHGACVFLMLLSEYSNKTSKVILTGEGADELFSGYSRYNQSSLLRLSDIIKSMGIPSFAIPNFWKFKTLKKTLNTNELKQIYSINDIEKIESIFNKNLNKNKPGNIMGRKFSSYLKTITYIDQTFYLQSLLERQDRMSMAASVETRVPFCNFKLFEIMNKINPKRKILNQTTKSILKDISNNHFSKEFIHRKKIGFTLPYNEWFKKNQTLGSFLDLISDQTFREKEYFDSTYVNKLINEHRDGIKDNSKILLRLISFEIWERMFIGKKTIIPSNEPLFKNI